MAVSSHLQRSEGNGARYIATLDDLDRQDELADLRDRIFGLRCAIAGAHFASDADRAGLLRLVEDIVEGQL